MKRPDIEDEKLIAELTRVCVEESERENKLGKQKVKAASVQNKKKDNYNIASFSEQCFATLNLVQSQLKELSSEVKILKGKQKWHNRTLFKKKVVNNVRKRINGTRVTAVTHVARVHTFGPNVQVKVKKTFNAGCGAR